MFSQFGEQTWINPYGSMLVLALILCWLYARRRARAVGIDVSVVDIALPLIFIVSIVGARLLSLAVPGDLEITGHLHEVNSRYRLFGLLLVAVPTLYLFSRLARISFRALLDLFALPAVLWLATLRLGCFFAGCCWGDLVHLPSELEGNPLAAQVHTLPWLAGDWVGSATRFPYGSPAWEQHYLLGLVDPLAEHSLPVHPTQLYESAGLLGILVLLRMYEKRTPSPGQLALLTAGAYCMLRFFIEYLRADNALVLGMHTSSQVIAVVLILAAATGFILVKHTR